MPTPVIGTVETLVSASSGTQILQSSVKTVAIGDVFVAIFIGEAQNAACGNIGDNNSRINWTQYQVLSQTNNCYVRLAYGEANTTGTTQIAHGTMGQAFWHSMTVWQITGGKFSAAATAAFINSIAGGSAPSVNITTTTANSLVIAAHGDWTANAPGTPAYRSSAVEDGREYQSTHYTAYYYHQAVAAAGAVAVGQTAPTGQTPGMVAIEVRDVTSPDPPTITYDNSTIGNDYVSTGSQTVSHAGNAAARCAVVLIEQNGTTADEVSGVTYAGVAMARLDYRLESTEAGAVYIYWLDGIAGGTQNVIMTTTAATSKSMIIATMRIGGSATSVAVAGFNGGTSTSIANPSWSISGLTAGTPLSAFEVIHSGLTTMTTTPASGWTLISAIDLGAQGRGYARQDVASSGTTLTCGWTAGTADDFVGSAVAFYPVVAGIYTFKQSPAVVNNSSGALISKAFASNVTAHSLLIAFLTTDQISSGTFTFTGGGTWATLPGKIQEPLSTQWVAIGYCLDATGGATTVQASWTGTPSFNGLMIVEYAVTAGAVASVLDVSTAGKIGTSTNPTDDPMSATAAGLAVSYVVTNGINQTAGATFTLGGSDTTDFAFWEYKNLAGAGSVTGAFTSSSVAWAIISAAFKPSTGAAVVPGFILRRGANYRR